MARSAIHPGEHLAEALDSMGITAAQLARDIRVPPNRITGILHFARAITADTALRLGRYFGTSAVFWMNLQQLYELRRAEQEIGNAIKAIPRGEAREQRFEIGGIVAEMNAGSAAPGAHRPAQRVRFAQWAPKT